MYWSAYSLEVCPVRLDLNGNEECQARLEVIPSAEGVYASTWRAWFTARETVTYGGVIFLSAICRQIEMKSTASGPPVMMSAFAAAIFAISGVKSGVGELFWFS